MTDIEVKDRDMPVETRRRPAPATRAGRRGAALGVCHAIDPASGAAACATQTTGVVAWRWDSRAQAPLCIACLRISQSRA